MNNNRARSRENDVAQAAYAFTANLVLDRVEITRSSYVAYGRFSMRNLSEVVIAQDGSSLGHRRDEEHNCDQNGQQLSSASSNGLACGDHVFARSLSL